MTRRFQDRADAGRQLAGRLLRYREGSPIVLGLARGGVPVAFEVARALGAPLDVWVVRKIGAPFRPELGIGAVCERGEVYIDPDAASLTEASELDELVRRKSQEVEERCRRFRRGKPAPDLGGRTVIVVDDGIARGGTARAALRAIRRAGPKRLILAVGVASTQTLDELKPEADEIVCVKPEPDLRAIGLWFVDFGETTDDEVMRLLDLSREGKETARPARIAPRSRSSVRVETPEALLQGDLVIPPGAHGLVLFAHGSGSSRNSPRNRYVAEVLRRAGLGTLLFDLLTAEEEEADTVDAHLRFDVDLLARRLAGATDWACAEPDTRGLRVGYFGASTGAAAALIAATQRPQVVGAIVARGGRPDLADAALPRVRAPTLLIVGELDREVLRLNRQAMHRLTCVNAFEIVPGATHLFEEPGTLEQVAKRAASWFVRHLAPHRATARPGLA